MNLRLLDASDPRRWPPDSLPRDWRVSQVRAVGSVRNGYPFSSDLFTIDEGEPLIRNRDLGKATTGIRYAGRPVEAARVQPGDVLISMDGDFRIARWQGPPALLNQRMCSFRATREVDEDFLVYQLPLVLERLNASTPSTTVRHLSASDVLQASIAVPPVAQQHDVVRFLDTRMTKVHDLIHKKQRLLDRVFEQFQAMVTATLWAEELPEDWSCQPLMRLTDPARPIMYGIVLPGPNVPEGIPVVKGGDVTSGRLAAAALNKTTLEIEAPYARARLRPGDVLLTIRGHYGDVAVVPDELKDANITQDVARISPRPGIDPTWLSYALRAHPISQLIWNQASGAAVKGVNIRDVKRYKVPTPPLAEQQRLARELDQAATVASSLRARVQEAIAKLEEYRVSLITAAVTGQLDIPEAS